MGLLKIAYLFTLRMSWLDYRLILNILLNVFKDIFFSDIKVYKFSVVFFS